MKLENKVKQVNTSSFKLNEDTETKSAELDLLSTPALNIDLSYFESNGSDNSQPVPLSDKSSKLKSLPNSNSNRTKNNKPESTSKVYLDKLLEEIFTNNQKQKQTPAELKIQPKTDTNSLGKEDDLFSDKKCDLTFFN